MSSVYADATVTCVGHSLPTTAVMPQRIITGPVVDAGGQGLPSGEILIAPILPTGRRDDGFVVEPARHPIVDGVVHAPVIVPGRFAISVFDGDGTLLRSFNAALSDTTLTSISLAEVWTSRGDADIAPGMLRDGDSILRLVPGGGVEGDVLAQDGSGMLWAAPSKGDMRADLYDRQHREVDMYNRAYHRGTQPMESIAGLDAELATRSRTGHTHDAGRVTSGLVAPARLGTGTPSGATLLRGDGAWATVAGVEMTDMCYQVSPGTYGQASVAGTWVTLLWNTFLVDEIGISAASDGVLTLPAGTYAISVDAAVFAADFAQLRIYNNTSDSIIRVGVVNLAANAVGSTNPSRLKATFVLDGESELVVQHIAYDSLTGGFGSPIGNYWPDFGTPAAVDVYASALLMRKN